MVTMREILQKQILSTGFVASVLLLLLNDLYLKVAFPGIITGKLSDFAGLFAFPFFFSVLLPNKKKWIFAITALVFILWKLPAADVFISFWNQYMPYSIRRVVDYSDYLALLILPISYFYKPNKALLFNSHIKKTATFFIASLAVFSFLATAGTHGSIKTYKFGYSKNEVSQAMLTFYQKYPKYKVPQQYESYTWHYGDRNSTDEWVQQANADSVSFHFFLDEGNIIFWTGFLGHAKNWHANNCELSLIGYIEIGNKWKFDESLTKEEKEKVTKYFEKEISVQLEEILQNQILVE